MAGSVKLRRGKRRIRKNINAEGTENTEFAEKRKEGKRK